MSGAGTDLLLLLPMLIVAVAAHEYAHARVAVWQGDPTPARLGRVTLNPLAHLDLVGSFLVPAFLWLSSSGFLFGWAKPVPVVPDNFRDRRKGDILVSLAGVAANFALALLLALFTVALIHIYRALDGGGAGLADSLFRMARFGLWFNILLGVFNLLPIPPLDGSHVLANLLPPGLAQRYREAGRYSMFLLLAVLFVPGLLSAVLWPVTALTDLADGLIGLLT